MTDTTPNSSRNYRTIVITKGIRGPSAKWEDIKKPLFIAAGNTQEEARDAIDAASQDTVTYILNNYSLKGHKHVISDVLGLSTALSDKLPVSHLGTGGDSHALVNPSEAGFMSPDSFNKLSSIDEEATKNKDDTFLLNRSNHTGVQSISTIDNLTNILNNKEPANANIQSHISSNGNVHNLTKHGIGLGNVDNTADVNKSVDSILSKDASGVSKKPNQEKAYAITFNLKNVGDVDSPPVTNGFGYAHIINIAGGSTGNISTGAITQLSTGPNGLAYRCATSLNDWGSWYKLYSSKDIIPEANGGTGVSTLKGKVLDDLIHLPSNTNLDTVITPNGYILDADNINVYQEGSILWVIETEHPVYGAIIGQSMQHLVSGIIRMRWMVVAFGTWQPWIYTLTENRVVNWYNNTTAEAPNAVIQETGFARSVSSDEYKTEIEPMLDEYADAIVQGAQPIYYRSTCEADPDDWSYWGISAEQLATIDPRLVHWWHSTKEVPQPLGLPPKTVPDLDSPLKPVGVQYSRIVPALLNVLKRQGMTITTLEERISALEGGTT